LRMLHEIIFLYLWVFAKDFEKVFPKYLQKQESGANVVQMLYRINQSRLFLDICTKSFNWFNSMYPMHINHNCKLVTVLHFIFALVCVGINHQK
jgi:hypothetical protein